MKIVNPSLKYKDSYYDLVNSAKMNGDINEMGNAYRDGEIFNEMLKRVKNRSKGINISKRDVQSTTKWIIVNNKVVGTIDLRHYLNQNYYERLGHIAYYIKPQERKKGYATEALGKALRIYEKKQINEILVTCYRDNIASNKVILKNGGILEKTVDDKVSGKKINRYYIYINNKIIPEVVWLTTNRNCNMNCSWCYANKYKNSLKMNFNLSKKYIREFNKIGIKKVILIGGEPTIYNDIDNIIKYITKQNIIVSMASNGIKFSDFSFAKKLALSGLNNVNISLKGTTEQEYLKNTKNKGLESVIEGYNNLQKLGVNVGLSYVICNNDIEKIDELYELIKNNNLNNISFQFYKPSIFEKNNNILISDLVAACSYIYKKFEKSDINYSIEMSLPLCMLPEDLLEKLIYNHRITTCCHIGKGKGIVFDTNFNIIPCNHFLNVYLNDEKINSEDILTFWNSSIPKEFRKKINTYPSKKCITCSKWKICGGGCFLRWLSSNFKREFEEGR